MNLDHPRMRYKTWEILIDDDILEKDGNNSLDCGTCNSTCAESHIGHHLIEFARFVLACYLRLS